MCALWGPLRVFNPKLLFLDTVWDILGTGTRVDTKITRALSTSWTKDVCVCYVIT